MIFIGICLLALVLFAVIKDTKPTHALVDLSTGSIITTGTLETLERYEDACHEVVEIINP